MKLESLALVLLLTYLTVIIVDWVLSLPPSARVTLTLIALVVYALAVFGPPLVTR